MCAALTFYILEIVPMPEERMWPGWADHAFGSNLHSANVAGAPSIEMHPLRFAQMVIRIYEDCSSSRHHCLPLLRQLVWFLPATRFVLPEPEVHFLRTAINFASQLAHDSTFLYARAHYWGSDEGFWQHIRQCDPITAEAVMDFGQKATCFQSCF